MGHATSIKQNRMTIEISWEEGARQINDCAYLFARDVREVAELELHLTLVEAKPQAPIEIAENDSDVALLKVGGRPIEEDETCRTFEITFDPNYLISYTVLNESFGRFPQPPEKFTGNLFRIFSWSHLLEYTKLTSYACDEYPGPLQHFEIVCLNHVFDVISTAPPQIRILSANANSLRE